VEKVIAPRPGIAPDATEADVLTLDVDLTAKSDPAFTVTFSHRTHGVWLTCPNCHTDLFEMKPGAAPIAPTTVHGERSCGACHGKVAFDIATGCLLCHLRTLPQDANDRVDWNRALADKRIAPRAGKDAQAVDQPTLDLDVEFTPKAQPALKAVFSHTSHTQWLACSNCDPRLFPMQAGMDGVTPGELHARRYCGACHGTVSFGMIGACGQCHPALQKARQHQEVLDLDIEITTKAQPASRIIFSHKTHRWVECASCHTRLFESAAGASTMPPAEIYGGKYCAVCHGKVTADLIAPCQRCHAAGDAK
jgi:c(7)-type cytochrome triheme protein